MRSQERLSLWLLLLILSLASAAISQTPTEKLRWTLTRRADGTMDWKGELPPTQPRQTLDWRAQAVWTDAFDSSRTIVLADTGWIASEYYPRHRHPLSRLSPAPAPGWILLRLQSPNAENLAIVRTAGESNKPAYDQLLEPTLEARRHFEDELIVARRYGVRRPQAESLLTIANLYVPMAQDLATDADRDLHGRWWLLWLENKMEAERQYLEQIRKQPPLWTALPNPPMNALGTVDGLPTVRIWTPEGPVQHPVRLAGVRGDFAPGDAMLVRKLGFNFIETSQANSAVAEEAVAANLAINPPLVLGSGEAYVLDGWKALSASSPADLAYHPWRLYAASLCAIEHRAGKLPTATSIPSAPELTLRGGKSAPPPWEMMQTAW